LEGLYVISPTGSHIINMGNFASAVLERLYLGHAPAKIVAELADFAKKREAPFAYVIALQGVTVTKRESISSTIYIDKPENLFQTIGREMMFRIDAFGSPLFDLTTRNAIPTAALVFTGEKTGVGTAAEAEKSRKADLAKWHREATRIICCMALSGNCTPIEVGNTCWTEHPALGYNSFGGTAGGNTRTTSKLGGFDIDRFSELYRASLTLDAKTWSTLELSTQRFIESKRADNIADRAIDLGIALEIALMRDIKPSTEISYKIGIRGAAITDDRKRRLEVFEKIRELYALRSKAAHSGSISDEKAETLDLGEAELRKILVALILRGGHPTNWEEELLI
jgi:hypothetical protein